MPLNATTPSKISGDNLDIKLFGKEKAFQEIEEILVIGFSPFFMYSNIFYLG